MSTACRVAYRRSAPDSIRMLATIYKASAACVPIPGVYLILDGSGTILYVGEARDVYRRMHQFVSNPQHPVWEHGAKSVQYERIEYAPARRDRKQALIGTHRPKCNTEESVTTRVDGELRSTLGPYDEFPGFSEFYDDRDLEGLERASALVAKAAELVLPSAVPQLKETFQTLTEAIDAAIREEADYGATVYDAYREESVAEEGRRIAEGEHPLRLASDGDSGEAGCPYCGQLI